MTESTKDTQIWICFGLFVNRSGAYAINSQSWTFETDYTKKLHLCRFWTQTATWRPNHTILTSNVKAILKAMIDTIFLGPSVGGGQIFLITLEGFYNKREYSGADWLVLLLMKSFLVLMKHVWVYSSFLFIIRHMASWYILLFFVNFIEK